MWGVGMFARLWAVIIGSIMVSSRADTIRVPMALWLAFSPNFCFWGVGRRLIGSTGAKIPYTSIVECPKGLKNAKHGIGFRSR